MLPLDDATPLPTRSAVDCYCECERFFACTNRITMAAKTHLVSKNVCRKQAKNDCDTEAYLELAAQLTTVVLM
jgi:hypothetical protein